jgi:hypothetical protein
LIQLQPWPLPCYLQSLPQNTAHGPLSASSTDPYLEHRRTVVLGVCWVGLDPLLPVCSAAHDCWIQPTTSAAKVRLQRPPAAWAAAPTTCQQRSVTVLRPCSQSLAFSSHDTGSSISREYFVITPKPQGCHQEVISHYVEPCKGLSCCSPWCAKKTQPCEVRFTSAVHTCLAPDASAVPCMPKFSKWCAHSSTQLDLTVVTTAAAPTS